MKPTTEEIKSSIEVNHEDTLEEARQSFKWPGHSHSELTIDDLVENYIEVKGIITAAIESGLMDKVSTNSRTQIKNQLNEFNKYVPNLHNDQGSFNNAASHLNGLILQIDQAGLRVAGSEYNQYSKKLKELASLNKEYLQLIKQVKDANEIVKESEQILSSANESLSHADSLKQKLNQQYDESSKFIITQKEQIENEREEAKGLNDEISAFHSNTKVNAEEVNKLKSSIQEFFGEIEQHKKTYEETENSYDKIEKEMKSLLNTNKSLNDQVKNLIEHATGASLFHAFDTKSKSLEGNLKWWMIGFVACILMLTALGIWIAIDLKNDAHLDVVFWVRVVSMLPLTVFAFFLNNQYSKNKNLLEEYSFKSSLSLSLEPYRDLVTKVAKAEDDKSLEFLIDSISKIYESPTKNVYKQTKEDKNLVNLDLVKDILKITKPTE